jgi:hypothetical protein
MNTKNFEKHRQISMLFTEYLASFSALTIDSSKIATYITKVNELSDLLLEVVVPLNITMKQRSVLNDQLRKELFPSLGRTINVAKALNDDVAVGSFMYFSREIQKKPGQQRFHNVAVSILSYLNQHEAEALAAGFTAERIEKLQRISDEAQGSWHGAIVNSSLRRVTRKSIAATISQLNKLLKNDLDWMMADYKEREPVLYERYHMLRSRRKSRRKKEEAQTDLCGIVRNQLTGEFVKDASIRFVNKAGYESVTDADGYYLIDDIDPGSYLVSCIASGYKTPAEVPFNIWENESLEVNFSLIPLQEAS